MPQDEFLTLAEVKDIFAEEISAANGVVSDTVESGALLFTRSILPNLQEVAAGDKVQGGVALRASASEVWVHPYTFRLVCRNGAISARAIQSRHVAAQDFETCTETAGAVRAAVRECCAAEAFSAAAEAMRSARELEADHALALLPLLSRLPRDTVRQILPEILKRFVEASDRSRYALMNAVTSVARDTRDPDLRWRLEEFGGEIPAPRNPDPELDDTSVELVMVGRPSQNKRTFSQLREVAS